MSDTENASINETPKFSIGDTVWALVGYNKDGLFIAKTRIAGIVYSRKDGKSEFEGYCTGQGESNAISKKGVVFSTREEAEAEADNQAEKMQRHVDDDGELSIGAILAAALRK